MPCLPPNSSLTPFLECVPFANPKASAEGNKNAEVRFPLWGMPRQNQMEIFISTSCILSYKCAYPNNGWAGENILLQNIPEFQRLHANNRHVQTLPKGDSVSDRLCSLLMCSLHFPLCWSCTTDEEECKSYLCIETFWSPSHIPWTPLLL